VQKKQETKEGNNMSVEKSKSIGGLYNKVSQKGLDYLNGFITIEGKRHKIVAFKNNNKMNETSPDYSIFISEPMGAASAAQSNQSPMSQLMLVLSQAIHLDLMNNGTLLNIMEAEKQGK